MKSAALAVCGTALLITHTVPWLGGMLIGFALVGMWWSEL